MTPANESPNLNDAGPPNSSEPTTTRQRWTESELRENYPDSFRPPNANFMRQQRRLSARGEALRRLGLTDSDVRDIPRITPRVKEAVGSVKAAIRIIKGDDAPDAIEFMRTWNGLSKTDQAVLRLEDILAAAKITPRRFMELLAGASMEHSAIVSKLIVSKSQPKVLKATVKAATDSVPILDKTGTVVGATNGDVKAQELFHKITGALPTPKGANFTFNQQINKVDAEPSTPKQQTPLQAMDAFLLEIDDVRKPRQISARAEPVIPVEMPENAPEIEYLSVED